MPGKEIDSANYIHKHLKWSLTQLQSVSINIYTRLSTWILLTIPTKKRYILPIRSYNLNPQTIKWTHAYKLKLLILKHFNNWHILNIIFDVSLGEFFVSACFHLPYCSQWQHLLWLYILMTLFSYYMFGCVDLLCMGSWMWHVCPVSVCLMCICPFVPWQEMNGPILLPGPFVRCGGVWCRAEEGLSFVLRGPGLRAASGRSASCF